MLEHIDNQSQGSLTEDPIKVIPAYVVQQTVVIMEILAGTGDSMRNQLSCLLMDYQESLRLWLRTREETRGRKW